MNQPIADEWKLWLDASNPDQADLEDSYIQLTKRFFDLIADTPSPLTLISSRS
ncbi:hypothetical protein CpMB16_08585 [Corynebacterium pseudotuberculosis]|uniref:Uncharacterized protein n=1 Tax=Corynebacterium pseudotuberculosis 258 TaxID=1168865 RepID=A0AAX1FKU1_CORPS|nr:replication protein RepA [Corynebacterium pseudotuberculosis]QGW56968.1 hypothetical protein CP258_08580 [Corynebacterium pseudotuberculosis 258]QGW57471.1 hypothetical protein CPCIP5297_08580 [Corynebacterium pseudotuberculosis CIP 52.97]QGX02782.1 hypothetical protein CP316_08570 [Corynebacterium pseudotuberculosis 316]QGX02934.1 hypothetical protein CP162_08555 [Corynebacterium pseudotuberculosis Cp162]ATB62641.1 Hypothetical protein BFF96_1767 [Corynebacterium pseudotuberculosis]